MAENTEKLPLPVFAMKQEMAIFQYFQLFGGEGNPAEGSSGSPGGLAQPKVSFKQWPNHSDYTTAFAAPLRKLTSF